MRVKRTAFFKYLAALLLFGSNGVAATGVALPSGAIVLARSALGAVTLSAVLCLTGRRPALRLGQAAPALASGACLGLNWLCLFAAFRLIGVGTATLLGYCGPVLVLALSALLFHERLTPARLAGIGAVLCGVVLLNGAASGESALGVVLGLLAAVFYAAMLLLGRQTSGDPGAETVLLRLVGAALVTAAAAHLRGELSAFAGLGAASWARLLWLGVVNTGLGCWLYFSAADRLPLHTVAVCGYLEPLSAVAFSAVLLGEPLTPAKLLGAALILGGAAFAELYRPARAANRRVTGVSV